MMSDVDKRIMVWMPLESDVSTVWLQDFPPLFGMAYYRLFLSLVRENVDAVLVRAALSTSMSSQVILSSSPFSLPVLFSIPCNHTVGNRSPEYIQPDNIPGAMECWAQKWHSAKDCVSLLVPHTGTAQDAGDLDELDGDLGRLHVDGYVWINVKCGDVSVLREDGRNKVNVAIFSRIGREDFVGLGGVHFRSPAVGR